MIYCALGPTLAASTSSCANRLKHPKKQAEQPHSFWKWGNGCDTSHSRAFRLWVWLVETWNLRDNEWFLCNSYCQNWWLRTIVLSGRLSTNGNTLVFHLGGRRGETSGWEKENKASKQEETSDHVQRMQLTWCMCHLTMPVTCIAVSLDQLEPKKTHEKNFWQLAAAFVWLQKLTTAFSK